MNKAIKKEKLETDYVGIIIAWTTFVGLVAYAFIKYGF